MNQMHDDLDGRPDNLLNMLPAAPASLQDQTVHELKRRRLLRRPFARIAPFAGIAALLVAVLAVIGLRPIAPPAATPGTHLLLLYEDEGYLAAQPGTEAARVKEYTVWAQDLARRGKLVDAAELSTDSFVATVDGMPVAKEVDSDFGRVAGFFLINTIDDSDASRIAAESPHMRYGGRVVVRPLSHH